jgi:pyridinium-3,5-biscarboxylic acid mononucleotide sulfurtransferase
MERRPAIRGIVRSERELVERLREGGPALVALSGGVDSALVASLAREALGDRAIAATVASASLAARELRGAEEVARAIGITHRVVRAEPLEDAAYRANGADRCYRCRTVETGALRGLGTAEGVQQYLDGVHLDDLGDDRPGLRAMEEAGFDHPLVWASWDKLRVRRLAHLRGLSNWDRPSDACLASRVAHGEPVSAELLTRIETAEGFLLARGFRRVRVRVKGGAARIEVDPAEVGRLEEPAESRAVRERLEALGFRSVDVDPCGYTGRDLLPVVP